MNKDGIYLFLVGVKQQSLTHSIPRYLILDWHILDRLIYDDLLCDPTAYNQSSLFS
jgi:hypothetical protein